MATSLPLVFDPPKCRKKPPTHLADLTEAERTAALEEAGLPGFRAKQLSNHYFARLVDDPAQMTDLPAAQREELVRQLLPDLMTPLRTLEADKGTTRKTLWKLFDGALVEFVQDLRNRPGADIGVHASISVAQALLAARVVDEVRLVIAPTIAGNGRRLLDGVPATRLEAIRNTTSPTGSLLVDYRVIG